ncbi:MAG: hypothetical protein IKB72_06180 [Ruminococcus sp.]|nr:hypothetical protein [Oscillospiraceae bacterium]MBR2725009.1 hypothetical protein [Ruminococcus sp.]
MLKYNSVSGISVLIVVLIIIAASVGCSVQKDNFDVSGMTNDEDFNKAVISTVDDIKNVVTDDDKLVINYFDAYTWIILFNDDNMPKKMVYIYRFENREEALKMTDIRKSELEKNRTMKVESCRNIEEYVVAELIDTSFDNISRETLENNFNGLIVY